MSYITLTGRGAVVTGAGSGIGRALALAFGAAGMQIVASDVEVTALQETVALARKRGIEAHPIVADVSDAMAIETLAARAYAQLGDIAILCNNAGVGTPPGRPLWEAPVADWAWMLDVNVMGVVHGIRAFVPRMLAAGSSAHIINTSSMAGLYAPPLLGPYPATKHAVVGISEQLARELSAIGAAIGVSVLCPLFVNTKILEAERNRPSTNEGDGHVMPPELAEQIRASLRNGQSPEEVAAIVVNGVQENCFAILCDDVSRSMARARFDTVIDSKPLIADTTIVAAH